MLTARTLSTHNIEINMGILIKRKGNCGPGNDRPKVIRYRQKSIIFGTPLRAPVGVIEPRSGGPTSEEQKLFPRADFFDAAFFPKNPVIRRSAATPFRLVRCNRHPREITAISVLDSRVEAVSWAAYRYPKNPISIKNAASFEWRFIRRRVRHANPCVAARRQFLPGSRLQFLPV